MSAVLLQAFIHSLQSDFTYLLLLSGTESFRGQKDRYEKVEQTVRWVDPFTLHPFTLSLCPVLILNNYNS